MSGCQLLLVVLLLVVRYAIRTSNNNSSNKARSITLYLYRVISSSQAGMFVFQLFDYYSGSRIILLLAFFQLAVIGWVYGRNCFKITIVFLVDYGLISEALIT